MHLVVGERVKFPRIYYCVTNEISGYCPKERSRAENAWWAVEFANDHVLSEEDMNLFLRCFTKFVSFFRDVSGCE